MAIDTTIPRTRRAILLGALGGAVAAAVAAVGRASPVSADDGQVVHVGVTYTATTATKIDATGAAAIVGKSDTFTGVEGSSQSSTGVYGHSATGTGVSAFSGTSTAVFGESNATDLPAMSGWSKGGSTGVSGMSGRDLPSSTPGKTGLFGYANQDGNAVGVKGRSGVGTGVAGSSHSNVGIDGRSTTSIGVIGHSGSFVGVYGVSETGFGMFGASSATDTPAIRAQSYGSNTAVQGFSGTGPAPDAPDKTGVFGSANQDANAAGVKGFSSSGRGGVFSGKVAQLRLVPSTDASHPSTGAKGDLFVDTSGRLWFYNGAAWRQVSLV